MIDQIHNVEILVTDQDRSLTFYVETLGFEKRDDTSFPSGGRWLTVGIPGAATAIALSLPEGHEGGAPGGGTGISLRTNDIRADYERMVAAGVSFVQPPTEEPWGDVATWFDDPDGNRFYLIQTAPA